MAVNRDLIVTALRDYLSKNFKISHDLALNPVTNYIADKAIALGRWPGAAELNADPLPVNDPRYNDKVRNLFNDQSFFNTFGGLYSKGTFGDAPSSVNPSVAPPQKTELSIDPLLSVQSIMDRASAPLSTTANEILAPSLPLIRAGVDDLVAGQKATAQSDFMKRGLTGSSTEVQTLTKDIPAAGAKAYVDAATKALLAAYPVAQAENALKTQTGISLRQIVSNEQLQTMSFDQKERLAQADIEMQKELNQIDNQYRLRIAEMNAQVAREGIASNMDQFNLNRQDLENQRQQARRAAIAKGLTTLAAFGIGFANPAAGMTAFQTGNAAAAASSGAGDILGFLMQ